MDDLILHSIINYYGVPDVVYTCSHWTHHCG